MPSGINFGGGGAVAVALVAPPYTLPVFEPKPIDQRAMYADDFVPPGAERILPNPRVEPKLHETPQMKYPDLEPLPSPNGLLTLFSDSGEAKKVMIHWLMLYRKGAVRPESLFHTRNSHEVMWSTDNERVAVTDFIGDNRSAVTIVDVRDDSATPLLDLKPALLPYLAEYLLMSPTFVRAHRWSDGSRVLVRGVGRMAESPFDQFGYEVLVDLAHLEDPASVVFVGGYLKKNTPQ